MKKVSLDGMVQVSEDIVRQAVKYIPEEEESGMRTVLKAADEYRAANMTPIFILDRYNMDILVVAAETFGKRLH
jgi:hypothetical protein